MMEQKYCVYCRTLHNEESSCRVCGKEDFQSIEINVQFQKNREGE
ncbi:hypothetical protein [Bacillus sp. V5-8f]|nr:hypothetical protein [Bacillus sp. V5-8f]